MRDVATCDFQKLSFKLEVPIKKALYFELAGHRFDLYRTPNYFRELAVAFVNWFVPLANRAAFVLPYPQTGRVDCTESGIF